MFVARGHPRRGPARRSATACDVDLWEDELPPPRDELLRRVAGVDGLLALLTDRVDDELLDAAGPGLRVVSNFAVGYDNIDVAGLHAARDPGRQHARRPDRDDRGPRLGAADGRGAPASPEGDRYVRDGRWRTWGPMTLLGTGRARRDARDRRLRAHRPGGRAPGGAASACASCTSARSPGDGRTSSAQTGATWVPLAELLATADFVSLHVSLDAETRHLIDAAALAAMRPTAILVNTARGPVVDTDALVDALRDGHDPGRRARRHGPGAAARRPPAGRDGQLPRRAPHRVGDAGSTRGRMAAMAAANLLAGVRGERLPTPVNPEVYERPA